MLGQSIGPVLGGILTQFFGFRSIFYFLFILGGLVLLFIVFFLPETLRVIAGNGTVRLQGIQRPLIHNFTKEPEYTTEPDPNRVREKISFMTVVEPLKFLFEKDVFVSLFFGGIVYTVWSMVTASTTSLFQERYHLNSLLTGLAFLPNGKFIAE
jgi:MFS family permease